MCRGLVTLQILFGYRFRVLSRDRFDRIDQTFFSRRIQRAYDFRQRMFPEPFYRLVHGEADGLPGIFIDRYGDTVCIQVRKF